MGSALRLRGPDEETFYVDDVLSFVFRRLSVIDIDGGAQPVWNEDESIWVAIDGRIYNHQEPHEQLTEPHDFSSKSDAEIFLHLYEEHGVKALDFLNGVYAIVLWDTKSKTLLLARDRLGVRPLYYAETEEGLLFGSELKALLLHPDCPRTFNWGDMSDKFVQEKSLVSTYVNDIYHLPAGHYATYSSNVKLHPKPYWNISDYFKQPLSEKSEASIAGEYYELLTDSVKKQLMSDVPVGLFLSGGVDSSVIAGLAATQSKNIHCFSIVERSAYCSGDVKQAREVAESLGLPFYPISFDVDDIVGRFKLADFENLICLMESPRFDLEWLFKSELHRAAKQLVPDLKVILLGQGADEFSGGYSKYRGSKFKDWDDYLLSLKESIEEQVIMDRSISGMYEKGVNPAFYSDAALNTYQKKMKMATYQLQHFNLWHEDRTSSYHGVESRVPFLDHRLVELLAGIPEKDQEWFFWDKKIIRNAMMQCMPDYPEDYPMAPFLITENVTYIEELVASLCINLYPDFKDKYLDVENPLFHADKLDDLFLSIQKERPTSNAWKLMEFMSVCVFNQYCLSPGEFIDHLLSDEKPTLPIIEPEGWSELEQQYDCQPSSQITYDCTLQTKVNVPSGCEILNLLTEEEGSTGLVLLCQGKEKFRFDINDNDDWLVMLLDAMGRYKDEPKDIQFWADKTGVNPNRVLHILNKLVRVGIIVQMWK